jgi:hypothetical protein
MVAVWDSAVLELILIVNVVLEFLTDVIASNKRRIFLIKIKKPELGELFTQIVGTFAT